MQTKNEATMMAAGPSAALNLPVLVRAEDLEKYAPGYKLRTIRHWIQGARDREVSRSGQKTTIPGNGLASALIREGRVTLIDVDRFREWLESRRGR